MTSNIQFNKEGDVWVAYFNITDDTNLHIDKKSAGGIKLYQKTAGEDFALVKSIIKHDGKSNDLDLIGAIYPKEIKVISYAEPIQGILTTM